MVFIYWYIHLLPECVDFCYGIKIYNNLIKLKWKYLKKLSGDYNIKRDYFFLAIFIIELLFVIYTEKRPYSVSRVEIEKRMQK